VVELLPVVISAVALDTSSYYARALSFLLPMILDFDVSVVLHDDGSSFWRRADRLLVAIHINVVAWL
jgi:hypothetical protein